MQNTTLANRQIKKLFGATLAASLLLTPLCCLAAQKTLTKRDFLPPVATINPKLEASQEAIQAADKQIEEVAFPAVDTQAAIRLKPKPEKLVGSITGQSQSEHLKAVLDIQKKVDEADLEYLWQATVEKNPVIHFSLEKLAAPPDLALKQSSTFLRKILNTSISGAGMASTFLPGGNSMYTNMISMGATQALQNIVGGRTKPSYGSLSPTEQIQLAGLIDELKARLIRSYQDYKNTLERLAQCHETTVKNNELYSKALASKNDMAMMTTGMAYYQALINETRLRQEAKLHRMELERLASPEIVSKLELVAHVNTTTTQTAYTPAGMLAKPLDIIESSTLNSNATDDLPYTIPDPIGPQPLIGPEPKSKKSAVPDIPAPLELSPSFKADGHLPSPMPKQTTSVHRKALAEGRPKTLGGLEPIEVLHP